MRDSDLKSKLANLTPQERHDLASFLGISHTTDAGNDQEEDNSEAQD